MEVDDVSRAGLGVQEVDVLGDHADGSPCSFQCRDGPVALVGAGAVHVSPADVVARPVVPPKRRIADELLERHRIARG